MIDPGNLTLADLLRFEVLIPFIVILITMVKRTWPAVSDSPYLAWGVAAFSAALTLLVGWVVGQVHTAVDVGDLILHGILAGLGACGLYDVTGGVFQRVQALGAGVRGLYHRYHTARIVGG